MSDIETKSYDFQIEDSQGKNGIISIDVKINFNKGDHDEAAIIAHYSELIVKLRQEVERNYRAKRYKLATDL